MSSCFGNPVTVFCDNCCKGESFCKSSRSRYLNFGHVEMEKPCRYPKAWKGFRTTSCGQNESFGNMPLLKAGTKKNPKFGKPMWTWRVSKFGSNNSLITNFDRMLTPRNSTKRYPKMTPKFEAGDLFWTKNIMFGKTPSIFFFLLKIRRFAPVKL